MRSRDGVALPVVLLALLATTVLITSVLLSSATEVSLSAAHQDATRGLFTAEGAIEAYVSENQLALVPVSNVVYTPPDGSVKDEVRLTVSRLGWVPNPTPAFATTGFNDTTFAITAVPARGGRRVMALIDKVNRPISMNVEGGLISGDTVHIKGNTTVSDGSDSQICSPDSAGEAAIQTTSDAEALLSNQAKSNLVGDNEKVAVSPDDLVQQLFGTTLDQLIARAHIRHTRSSLGTARITSGDNTANKLNPQLTPHNWGCPTDVYTDQNNVSLCTLDGDQTHLPIVAIDASNSDGTPGTVSVNLSHGQGMLIIYNGDLSIQGNFAYKGVVLVEGNFDIRATGGGSTAPKIEGAVIGLGFGANNLEATDDNTTSGSPTIRYNRCAINTLRTSWEQTTPFLQMGGRTFGWAEIVQ